MEADNYTTKEKWCFIIEDTRKKLNAQLKTFSTHLYGGKELNR